MSKKRGSRANGPRFFLQHSIDHLRRLLEVLKEMLDNKTDQINILDVLAFLGRWRKFIFSVVLLCTVTATVISFLLPAKYRSTALIRGSSEGGQNLPSFLASRLSVLGSMANVMPSLGEVPGELYVVLLKSRELSERVIQKFNLRTVYHMEAAPLEDVLLVLAGNTRFDLDAATGTIRVDVQDRIPGRAKEMADFYVDELDKRNRELRSYQAQKERQFVGNRLNEARAQLTLLEDSLHDFQVRTGVLNIQEQVKATIQAAAAIEAQRLTLRTELAMNQHIFGAESPEARYAEMKIASLDSSMKDMGGSNRNETAESSFLLRLQDAPDEGRAYLRLMRDIETQQLLVAFLLQQHEQAKLEEVRNTPTLMRLDSPREATKRIWPRRGLMALIAAGGSLIFSFLLALLMDFMKRARNDPQYPHFERMKELQRSWRA
jgi:tyrosine-protein kinase Etk/Wzc